MEGQSATRIAIGKHILIISQGMEALIKQAFLHVDMIGQHVMEGHYDLTGPNGEIILPQVWDTTVQPDWEVSMHMWPMPDPHPPFPMDPLQFPPGFDPNQLLPPKKPKGDKKSKDKNRKSMSHVQPDVINVMPAAHAAAQSMGLPPPPPPPPGMFPPPGMGPGGLPDPLGMGFPPPPPDIIYGGPMLTHERKKSSSDKKKKEKNLPPLAAWMAGRSRGTVKGAR